MPECIDCGARIQSGSRCQQHALEAQHGTLADRREDCEVCETTIDPDEPESDDYDEPAHAECGGQARCDGGQRYTELPAPDRLFQAIGDGEVDMRVLDHDDDVQFRTNQVPGGKFGVELTASYSYAGYDCNQNILLDRESAEALRDTLDEILEKDSRGDRR